MSIDAIKQDFQLTLRDYFAAKAMQGMLSSSNEILGGDWESLAEDAYDIAGAMLKEMEKQATEAELLCPVCRAIEAKLRERNA